MNISIKRLVDDHINLRYTLVVLARYVTQCQSITDLQRSSDFIKVALDYLCDYPELFHHPVEERLIQFLLVKDPSIRTVSDNIAQQHRELENTTRQLRQQFSPLLEIKSQQQVTELKAKIKEL